MNRTEDNAIFEEDGDTGELDTNDIHPDVPAEAILRSCLKILIQTWIVNNDW